MPDSAAPFDPASLIVRTPPIEAAKTPEPPATPAPEPEKPVEAEKEAEPAKEPEKTPEPADEHIDGTPDKYAQKQARKIAKLESTLESFASSLEEMKELIKSQGKPATPAQREAVAEATATQSELEKQLDALASGSESADYVGADTALAKKVREQDSQIAKLEARLSQIGKPVEEMTTERYWEKYFRQPGYESLDRTAIYEKALEDTSVEEVTADLRRILRKEPDVDLIASEVEERASKLFVRRADDAAKAQLAKAGKKDESPAPRPAIPKPPAPHLPSPTPDGGSVFARTNGSRPIAAPAGSNGNVLTDPELAALGRELKGRNRR